MDRNHTNLYKEGNNELFQKEEEQLLAWDHPVTMGVRRETQHIRKLTMKTHHQQYDQGTHQYLLLKHE